MREPPKSPRGAAFRASPPKARNGSPRRSPLLAGRNTEGVTRELTGDSLLPR